MPGNGAGFAQAVTVKSIAASTVNPASFFLIPVSPIPNPILSGMRDWAALLPWLEQASDGEVHFSTTGGAHAACELHWAQNGLDECAEVDAVVNADVIEEIWECCTRFECGDRIDFPADEDRE